MTAERPARRNPNELPLRPLPLSRFHWDRVLRRLSAEASDFGPGRTGLWWLGRLYADACDVGIVIRSEATGREERFVLDETVRDDRGDDEVVAWTFKPLDPESRVRVVTILND